MKILERNSSQTSKRRILGIETVTLLDGSSKEIKIYAITYQEREEILNDALLDSQNYDQLLVIENIMRLSLQDQVNYEDLDHDMTFIYSNYFADPVGNNSKKVQYDRLIRGSGTKVKVDRDVYEAIDKFKLLKLGIPLNTVGITNLDWDLAEKFKYIEDRISIIEKEKIDGRL